MQLASMAMAHMADNRIARTAARYPLLYIVRNGPETRDVSFRRRRPHISAELHTLGSLFTFGGVCSGVVRSQETASCHTSILSLKRGPSFLLSAAAA